jgi:hypothetical protein
MSVLAMFGGPAARVEQMGHSVCIYRYASVEDGSAGLEASFEFVKRRDRRT